MAPALACGNTIILKPPHQNPLSTLHLASLLTPPLPAGIVNVIPGDAQIGAALVSNPLLDKISFTGSTSVGSIIAREAASATPGPKPCTMELGGKAPMIVCDDAIIDKAVDDIVGAAFSNAGQNCCAGTRLLVQEGVYDEVLEKLKAKVDELVVGDHEDEGTDMGPLVFHAVPDTAPIAQEEVFGPVLPVLKPFKTLEESITRANASPYALAAGIWSENRRNLDLAVRGLDVGIVWANCYNMTPPYVPVGGRKGSGYGKDQGLEAINEYSFTKAAMFAR
ncbi:Aldehyde dehydrogenase, mitochondrial [Rhizophlyctis rosea]|nr:Aldehyde dehydrogenase, mitochondrial [Rhizophlyctis rosea]